MSDSPARPEVTRVETERIFKKLDREAESAGYHLNPNREFTLGLIEGMLVNELRYGYWACPCRLASGNKAEDLDIICPCDYRDPDLAQHGTCYCALYVSQDIVDGRRKPARIPERRQAERRSGPSAAPADAASPANSASPNDAAAGAASAAPSAASAAPNLSGLSYPLWRCRVCGYLCARDGPPEVCPICRAKKDRFERFL